MSKDKHANTDMAEWKTAGWVFGVLALIIVSVIFYVNKTKHIIFSYQNCREDYNYTGSVDTLNYEYEYQEARFGECVTDYYLSHPTKEAAKTIVRIGSKYIYQLPVDSTDVKRYQCLDSLIKYRKTIFDLKIAWD